MNCKDLVYDELSGRVGSIKEINHDGTYIVIKLSDDPKILKYNNGWRKTWEVTVYEQKNINNDNNSFDYSCSTRSIYN